MFSALRYRGSIMDCRLLRAAASGLKDIRSVPLSPRAHNNQQHYFLRCVDTILKALKDLCRSIVRRNSTDDIAKLANSKK
jgi:hypothetical protein